jgi:hypothetical protein
MMTKRTSSAAVDLTRLCPAHACIEGVVWNGRGPAETCRVCHGRGRVTLSEWMKHEFIDARDAGE